ncbi:MAG: tyrosine-type recombinase/integrase [Clostridiales bacterium]|jgi:site-specific recombinase XerD|nr:tyrosine-type recombinase/integrase [Clostridiales bacterium]
MVDNYFENRAERTIEKTREILDDLPQFANEFFVGIQMRTSELTRLNYACDLRVFFDYLAKKKFKNSVAASELTLKDLETLTALDFELFLEYLSSYSFGGKRYKCGERSKARKLCALRSFFKYYFKRDKLSANVTVKVDLPKIHGKEIIRLEPDEVVDMLDGATDAERLSLHQRHFHNITQKRDIALLTLLLGTGIRVSECVGLNRADVDFNAGAFTVTRKGGGKDILYFADEVSAALQDYLKWLDAQIDGKTDFGKKIRNFDALFLSLQGKRISVRAVEMLVKKYAALASPLKKITPHKLRSTYGTALYRETNDIYVVAEVLGHKDINTTKKHYAAISDDIKRNAARVVKLRDKKPDNDNEM